MKKRGILLGLVLSLLWTQIILAGELNINAQSALLIDVGSGRILWEHNPHIKLPMASTTKIMTALLALEEGELDDRVEVSIDAVGIEGSSIYLYENENISLEDLIYGLMLRSGNDSAVAIAKHIGTSLEDFIHLMNGKAREIGAENTQFQNPHGLSEEGHYTTAYDLGLITRQAMSKEKFKEITSSKLWRAKREKNNLFYNKNKTLWDYEGGDGVKTGYTLAAGRCLVTSASRGGNQLIALVLNDRNWFEDCYTMMDYGFDQFKNYVIVDKGKYFGRVPVDNGEKEYVSLLAQDTFIYPLKEEEVEQVQIYLDIPENIKAPVKEKEELGSIKVFLEGKLIHREKLVARDNVGRLGFWQKIFNK